MNKWMNDLLPYYLCLPWHWSHRIACFYVHPAWNQEPADCRDRALFIAPASYPSSHIVGGPVNTGRITGWLHAYTITQWTVKSGHDLWRINKQNFLGWSLLLLHMCGVCGNCFFLTSSLWGHINYLRHLEMDIMSPIKLEFLSFF